MKLFRYGAGLVVVAILLPTMAAADLYRWRDAGGQLHVTDDPTKVPPEKLDSARVHSLRDLNVSSGGASSVSGRGIFEVKCGSCHLAGMESTGDGEDGKLAILPFLIDQETHVPVSRKEALRHLASAAAGTFSDMPAIEISSGDLEKIADYLLGKLR